MAQIKNTLYIPKEIEPRWSLKLADFSEENADSSNLKKPFSMVFSLKSINSTLSLSEVLQYSLQDCYVRFKRMQGYEVLYIPGILYESEFHSVEPPSKKWTVSLERKQAILQEDWTLWKDRQIKNILRHLQWMGISCNYSKLYFSREEPFQKAVRYAFIQLYEEGVLTSHPQLVDWCFECKSFLNSETLIEKEEEALRYQVKFPLAPLKNNPGEKETLFFNIWLEHLELVFGIQGFLIPANEEVFKKFVGRSVILPFSEREVPIFVDPELPHHTEAYPIIPGHSKIGFRVAQKYNLRMTNVFTPQGTMAAIAGDQYSNLSREDCRAKVFDFLKEKEWLKGREQEYGTPKKMKKIKCFRCGSTTENILFTRWYLKLYKLVQELETRLPDKDFRLQRKRNTRQISRFLDPLLKKEPHLASEHRSKTLWRSAKSTQEWPVTAEHWDGIPIPLWYCDVCGGKIILSETLPEKCPQCQGTRLRQEQGVFTEEFFRWLWPLVFLGWPETKSPRYQQFTPNNLLISLDSFKNLGKMVLGAAHFAQSPPFRTLYLSGTIYDRPRKEAHLTLESMIKRYGADSIRFSLLSLVSEGRNLKLSMNWYRAGQKFVNKLWNLSLFLRKILPLELKPLAPEQSFSFEDRWILSNLHRTL
ncbi:MAG: class I tRNA ligase family protein, partial [Planctomycetota bacterium]